MLIGAGADKQKSLILTKCIYAAFKSDSVYTYFPRDTKETKLLLPHQGSVSTSFFPESLKICRQEIFSDLTPPPALLWRTNMLSVRDRW